MVEGTTQGWKVQFGEIFRISEHDSKPHGEEMSVGAHSGFFASTPHVFPIVNGRRKHAGSRGERPRVCAD